MCGIFGSISTKPVAVDCFLHDLRHRGPDDSGSYTCRMGDVSVVMGHTRLSIIDLSHHGHQPMQTADGQITLVYNGEIYNFQELKKQYFAHHIFRSATDTEVLLLLYERFGCDCFKKVIGDFAVAIFDERHHKFVLARDRMGIKPLYFMDRPNHFAFASEVKPLLKLAPDQQIDPENVGQFFVFKYVPGQNTLFRDIKRLPPGHWLTFDLHECKWSIQPYWQIEKKQDYSRLSYSQAQETLYELVKQAATSQLIADVPVGTFLSGGLDSSTLAYFIRDHPQIRHYCARKSTMDLQREGSSSDYFYAAKLAHQWGLNLTAIDIGSLQATRELIAKTLFYSDDLIADGSQIPSYLITAAAAKTSRVLLSGMGADELFYGYAGHQLSLMAYYLDHMPSFLSFKMASSLGALKPGHGHFKAYKRFLQKFGRYFNSGKSRYGFFNIVGDFNNSASVFQGAKDVATSFMLNYFEGHDEIFEAITRFEFDNFLVKNLHYLDRMCMANSVEGRVPFLDHRIVEFAFSLPRYFKLSNLGRGKRILKDTMAPYLPDYIHKRRKAGFGMPLRSIFSDEGKIYTLLNTDFFEEYPGFSIGSIKQIIHNHVHGIEDNSALIYALISFQIWYQEISQSGQ